MTTESRSQCSRCRGCTSSTRLRGRHRRRSHLMYHRRTSPSIHRPRRSRTCTNRRGDSCEGWAEARGPARGPSTRAGRDMAARADLRPVSGCDSCVRCCGPEKVPNSAAAARNGQSGMCNGPRDFSMFFVFLRYQCSQQTLCSQRLAKLRSQIQIQNHCGPSPRLVPLFPLQ